MAEPDVQVPTNEPEDSKASVINGLAGVAAAVATEEALSHVHLGGAAGLVAASVGGLVVYGLDHTEFGKTIEHALLPGDHSAAIMPDCLPKSNLIDDMIELVSRPFETIAVDGEFDGNPGPTVPEFTESVDNIVGGMPVELPTDVSPAQHIIDQLTHQGIVICDPPPNEIDTPPSAAETNAIGPHDMV